MSRKKNKIQLLEKKVDPNFLLRALEYQPFEEWIYHKLEEAKIVLLPPNFNRTSIPFKDDFDENIIDLPLLTKISSDPIIMKILYYLEHSPSLKFAILKELEDLFIPKAKPG